MLNKNWSVLVHGVAVIRSNHCFTPVTVLLQNRFYLYPFQHYNFSPDYYRNL